jgi:hypothetical protein
MIKEHETNMIMEMEDESTGPGVYLEGVKRIHGGSVQSMV